MRAPCSPIPQYPARRSCSRTPRAAPTTCRDDTDGVTALFFGYTQCPDVCPTTMADLATAVRNLASPDRERVTVVFVAEDPANDTPAAVREWLDHFDDRFVGLIGGDARTAEVLDELHLPRTEQHVDPPDAPPHEHGGVEHTGVVYLSGPATVRPSLHSGGTDRTAVRPTTSGGSWSQAEPLLPWRRGPSGRMRCGHTTRPRYWAGDHPGALDDGVGGGPSPGRRAGVGRGADGVRAGRRRRARTRRGGRLPRPASSSSLADLHEWLAVLYGGRAEVDLLLARALRVALAAAAERPAELRRLDRRREIDPGWFQRTRMQGYVCYVDRFCGTLAELPGKLDYLAELGTTYLHLMPLLQPRPGENDGGYAVLDYRAVDPRLGTMDDLADVARAAARAAG